MATTYNDDKFVVGLSFSLLIHFILFLFIALGIGSGLGQVNDAKVYSVTVEGGKVLGGRSQVPDTDKPVIPMNVAQPPPKAEQKVESERKAKAPEPKPEEKAEVSINQKQEEKPKPETKAEPVKKETKQEEKKPPAKKEETKSNNKKQTAKTEAPSLDKEYENIMKRALGESAAAGGTGVGAAKIGGKGTGGGEVKPREWLAYYNLLERSIKQGWRWFDPKAPLVAKVVFNISPEGVISNVQLEASSGVREYDESVIRAVRKASPVPMPPASVYQDFRFVRMTFDPRQGLF